MEQIAVQSAFPQVDDSARRRMIYELPAPVEPRAALILANYLGDPSPAVCEAVVEILAQASGRYAAEVAAFHLRAAEPAERAYAMEALIRMKERALPALAALLEDPDVDIRKLAVDILAGMRIEAAVPALASALQDGDANVVAAAAEALGMSGLTEAVPALAAAIERGPDWVRVTALSSLGLIGGAHALRIICSPPPQASSLVLTAAAAAARWAGLADPRRAVAFLAALMNSDQVGVRGAALESLAPLLTGPCVASPTAQQIIASVACLMMNASNASVRAAAITCLVATNAPVNPGDLVSLLDDPALPVRRAALEAVSTIEGIAPGALVAVAARDGEDTELRALALHRLAEGPAHYGDDDIATLTAIAYQAREPALRAAAACTLLRHDSKSAGNKAVLAVMTAPEVLDDEAALAEFAACPVPCLISVIADCLMQCDVGQDLPSFGALLPVKRAMELAQCTGGPALLRLALRHPVWTVRAHAIRLICEGGSPQVSQGSGQVWTDELAGRIRHDPDERVRTAAVNTLGRLGHIDADTVLWAMADASPMVRRASFMATLSLDTDRFSAGWQAEVERIARAAVGEDNPEMGALGLELLHRMAT